MSPSPWLQAYAQGVEIGEANDEMFLRAHVHTVFQQKGAQPHDNFIVLCGLMRCLEFIAL